MSRVDDIAKAFQRGEVDYVSVGRKWVTVGLTDDTSYSFRVDEDRAETIWGVVQAALRRYEETGGAGE